MDAITDARDAVAPRQAILDIAEAAYDSAETADNDGTNAPEYMQRLIALIRCSSSLGPRILRFRTGVTDAGGPRGHRLYCKRSC